MNEEQKEWYKRFWSSFGVREFLRFGCAFFIWEFIGLGLYIWLNNIGILIVFMSVYFSFPILTAGWQPAYSVLRKILGNPNMPEKIMPSKKNWGYYISLAVRLAISTMMIYGGIKLMFQ
ncbi:MAG: hypothetical protein HYZ23_08935 [Chloroflexi bacterium]|nr:hypothetical protein [Chloroflexota bacterium]